MTDLTTILPDFATASFAALLPTLERHGLTTTDLVSLDPAEICRRTRLPLLDTRRLCNAVTAALRADVAATAVAHQSEPRFISTLDDGLDRALGGGVPVGYLTEVTGESGTGKTQLLLTLLLAVQLAPPRGLGRSAVYVSTQGPLPTGRLAQLLAVHPQLASKGDDRVSLDRVSAIEALDLEAQDHILRFQVPVELQRRDAGLLVVDSVAANFRAEFELTANMTATGNAAAAARAYELLRLGAHLRDLARRLDIAVVVANQVSDRFATAGAAPDFHPLLLDHQQRWFTGWGDDSADAGVGDKTPSLGLVWSTQVACRIALLRRPAPPRLHMGSASVDGCQRWMKLVFAQHAASSGPGLKGAFQYEVTAAGLRSVRASDEGRKGDDGSDDAGDDDDGSRRPHAQVNK